jgi:cation:H+ antiporter
MADIVLTGLEFCACAVVIVLAGIRLSRFGDVIAEKTGLGGTWVGLILLATVTSIPELITGASSVVLFHVPDIAVGDAVGSCMFNLLIFAFLDVRHPQPFSSSIHGGHVLPAAFGLVQLGLAAMAILAGSHALVLGWVGLQSVVFLAVYVLAMRTISKFERARAVALAEHLAGEPRFGAISLRRAAILFALYALVLTAAAVLLPGVGDRLAHQTGLAQSVVGSLFVAASTSLPEVVVSMAAARLGALDLAAGNLLGSNLFNIAVLGFDDVIGTSGPLLASASPTHLISLVAAMVMTGIAIIGLTYRAQRKRFRLSWDTLAMVTVYAIAAGMLWHAG